MALTQGDVGLVNGSDEGLRRHDDTASEITTAHPPTAGREREREWV